MSADPRPEQLQRRLVRFGIEVCRDLRAVPPDPVNTHFVLQLVRSSSSVAARYAEARAAESRRDFVHKMQGALKELRESAVWLEFVSEIAGSNARGSALGTECDELIAIFVASVKSARRSGKEQP